jgi:hypothetical protein
MNPNEEEIRWVAVETFPTENAAKQWIEDRKKRGDFSLYKVVGEPTVFGGENIWNVYVAEPAKKHWLFRDLPAKREAETPLRGTLGPYVEAARVKPLTEWTEEKKPLRCPKCGSTDIMEVEYKPIGEAGPVERRFICRQCHTTLAPEKINREKIQAILNFIVDVQLMYGWVGKEDIYTKFETLGYSREEVEKALSQLLREGTIYEPREGFVRKT